MDKTTSIPGGLQISGGGVDSKDIKNGIIDIESTIKRELREEVNLNLDIIDYELKFIEYPDEKRNAYGFLAVGRVDMTKDELERYFEEYKKYLIENKLDDAFVNTKRLESYHLANGTNDRLKKLPSTEAYKLIEMILEKRH